MKLSNLLEGEVAGKTFQCFVQSYRWSAETDSDNLLSPTGRLVQVPCTGWARLIAEEKFPVEYATFLDILSRQHDFPEVTSNEVGMKIRNKRYYPGSWHEMPLTKTEMTSFLTISEAVAETVREWRAKRLSR